MDFITVYNPDDAAPDGNDTFLIPPGRVLRIERSQRSKPDARPRHVVFTDDGKDYELVGDFEPLAHYGPQAFVSFCGYTKEIPTLPSTLNVTQIKGFIYERDETGLIAEHCKLYIVLMDDSRHQWRGTLSSLLDAFQQAGHII